MQCPDCNAPMVWGGSRSGGLSCRYCVKPDKTETVYVAGKGYLAPTLARYYYEVQGFHRKWCKSRQSPVKGAKPNPKLCDCGFDQPCSHSDSDIEQLELAHYGAAPKGWDPYNS